MDQHKTAIHEAGHAVAFYRLFGDSWRIGHTVSIEPKDDTAGRHAAEDLSFEGADELTPDQRQMFENEAIYACAGYAALIAADYPEDEAENGCWSDFECAEKCSDKPLATIKQESIALMSRPENVNAMRRIADELLLRKKLDSDVVDVLIDVADGKTTEEDYQRFLALVAHSQNG